MNYLQELWAALDFGSLPKYFTAAGISIPVSDHPPETCHGLAAYALGDPTAKRMHPAESERDPLGTSTGWVF